MAKSKKLNKKNKIFSRYKSLVSKLKKSLQKLFKNISQKKIWKKFSKNKFWQKIAKSKLWQKLSKNELSQKIVKSKLWQKISKNKFCQKVAKSKFLRKLSKLNWREFKVKDLAKIKPILLRLWSEVKRNCTKQKIKETTRRTIIFVRSNYVRVRQLIHDFYEDSSDEIAEKPIKIGKTILIILSVIFLIWGVFAPINSASIAPGQMVLDFNKKTVQHLEGGIVESLLVREGQYVFKGQPLLFLQDVATRSEQELLSKQLWTQEAVKMRLEYQRDNFILIQDFAKYKRILELEKVVGPLMLEDRALVQELHKLDYDPLHIKYGFSENLYQIIENQKALYLAKENSYVSKIGILHKRIQQFEDEIVGIKAQKDAKMKQIRVVYQEYKIVKKLVTNNNSPLIRKLEVQKQIAELEGSLGELEAAIAKANQTISETELEIINFQNEALNEIIAELQETEIKISDISEQLASARDVLQRTIIKAPISGKVLNLSFHTIGAVIPPGGEIMHIVPQDDRVIVEAKVSPQDIDLVFAGLEAKVQLSAYKAKKVPRLIGEVISVSGDSILDEQTGSQYFLVRIKIPESEIDVLKADVRLYPGMPADVFVVTGSRTFFDYLFSPIKDATYRAFREE